MISCRMGLLYLPTGAGAHHGCSRSPRRADWVGGVRRAAMLNALHVCGFILLTAVLSPPACNKQRAREILYIVADKIAKSEPRPGVAHLGERGTRQKRNTGNRIPHHQIVYTTAPLGGPIDGYTMHIIYTQGVPHNKQTPTEIRIHHTTRTTTT